MGGGVAHGIDCISIHAPREGCDAMGGGVAWLSLYFNPRTPRGVRRAGAGCSGGGQPIFQSTHPARGATWRSLDAMEPIVISIHAPREGCDRAGTETHQSGQPISIHAPREGCDAAQPFRPQGRPQFQSTHPARGATCLSSTASSRQGFQSTHPARGATPGLEGLATRADVFQSTHPARGATRFLLWFLPCCGNFNPRTPRGVRLQNQEIQYHQQEFQSTHPARGATLTLGQPAYTSGISIHAPREGCDGDHRDGRRAGAISIHAPREGCDCWPE